MDLNRFIFCYRNLAQPPSNTISGPKSGEYRTQCTTFPFPVASARPCSAVNDSKHTVLSAWTELTMTLQISCRCAIFVELTLTVAYQVNWRWGYAIHYDLLVNGLLHLGNGVEAWVGVAVPVPPSWYIGHATSHRHSSTVHADGSLNPGSH
jgi:hypothetical protein